MSRQPGFRTRTPKKQNQIVRELRDRILSGSWAPGSQLPIRTDLEMEFGVSSTTLQRALDQIRKEGFVFARGSSGTFVNPYPPHTHHYGLVFPAFGASRNDPLWSGLEFEALRLNQSRPGLQIPIFRDGNDARDNPRTADMLKTVEEGRLAALIFASTYPAYSRHGALMEAPIPKVCICSAAKDIPVVAFDYDVWLHRALDLLIARGRRRIAVLLVSEQANRPQFLQYWEQLIASRGVVGGAHWWIGLTFGCPQVVKCLIQLLMGGSERGRPDGIIILNDHFTGSVIGGLMQCGVSVPNDVEIVAHCNFPQNAQTGLPIQRLGFSIRTVMESLVSLVDAQLAGEEVPLITKVEPVTDEEFLAGNFVNEPEVLESHSA